VISFGSLDDRLKGYTEGAALLQSAGPVSDRFIQSLGARDLLNGPVGSGKTTACIKRALLAAVRTPPMIGERDPQGRPVRRYRLSLWRETYAQLWGTTIKSWQKVLNPDKGIGEWQGASPRAAVHRITFEDGFGPILFEAMFFAFGDDADPDDLGGTEYTDAYCNEQDKLREALYINLARSVGRYPNRGEIGLPDDERIVHGRIFGDCNAPAPDTWVYRDWWSPKKPPGYQLFRQPGGFHAEAERQARQRARLQPGGRNCLSRLRGQRNVERRAASRLPRNPGHHRCGWRRDAGGRPPAGHAQRADPHAGGSRARSRRRDHARHASARHHGAAALQGLRILPHGG